MTDEEVEVIAAAAHEANRAYCIGIGDMSLFPWSGAPDWQRESARKGVRFALSGEKSPAEQHAAWMDDKLKDGWKFGPVKDMDKKEHPCMQPYNLLSAEHRKKDEIFLTVVATLRDLVRAI